MQHERVLQAVLAARFLAHLIGDRARTSSWPVTWMPTPTRPASAFWTGRQALDGMACVTATPGKAPIPVSPATHLHPAAP
jgi:2-polyprenyl-6-methoxyphenol hydroxylase-like FAD-dependent oxidoreductase